MKKQIFYLTDGLEYVIDNPKNSIENIIKQSPRDGYIILEAKNGKVAFRTEAIIMVIEK